MEGRPDLAGYGEGPLQPRPPGGGRVEHLIVVDIPVPRVDPATLQRWPEMNYNASSYYLAPFLCISQYVSCLCCFICAPNTADLRISSLVCMNRHPLYYNLLSNVIMVALVLASFFGDAGSTCKPDLRLWLTVQVGRGVCRFMIQAYIAAIAIGSVTFRGDIHVIYKVMEMLDVFGMVWFSVGNLLVFNGTHCAETTPITFWSSLFYVLISYMYLIIPVGLRFSILLCLPLRDPRFQLPLHMDPNAMAGNNLNLQGGGNETNLNQASSTVVAARKQFLRRFLEEYGSSQKIYVPRHCVDKISAASCRDCENGNDASGIECDSGEGSAAKIVDDDANGEFCPICLLTFGQEDPLMVFLSEQRGHIPGPSALAHFARSVSSHEIREAPPASTLANPLTNPASDRGQPQSENLSTRVDTCECVTLNDEQEGCEAETAITVSKSPPSHSIVSSGGRSTELPCGVTLTQLRSTQETWMVVSFPCMAEHLFHVQCLHSWLTSTRGGLALSTCPCCRERPSTIEDRIRMRRNRDFMIQGQHEIEVRLNSHHFQPENSHDMPGDDHTAYATISNVDFCQDRTDPSQTPHNSHSYHSYTTIGNDCDDFPSAMAPVGLNDAIIIDGERVGDQVQARPPSPQPSSRLGEREYVGTIHEEKL